MSLNSNRPTTAQFHIVQFTEQGKPEEHIYDFNPRIFFPFYPLKPTTVHTINSSTNPNSIGSLMEQAEKTMTFSIYSRRSHPTTEVILTAIEFLRIEETSTITIVFDLLNRPLETSPLMSIIHGLLFHIFKPGKRGFIWDNDQQQRLDTLVTHGYLSRLKLESMNIMQLEKLFKHWYNKTFPHKKDCSVGRISVDDSSDCICHYRPHRDMNDIWTLLEALNYTFTEVIYTQYEESVPIPRDIQISTMYCMTLTKLAVAIQLDWKQAHLSRLRRLHKSYFKLV